MPNLVPFEIEILREVAGEEEPRLWGAAVGVALERLRSIGFVNPHCYLPTAAGRAYLDSLKGASDAE